MSENVLDRAEQSSESAQAAIDDAREELKAADVTPEVRSVAEERLARAEQALNEHSSAIAELRALVEARAEREHSHPTSSSLSALEEHLTAIEREEQEVKRLPWYKRRII